MGFIQNIRVGEAAVAGLWFANGWVSCPPAAAGSGLSELPPMPVSGTGITREECLSRLMMEAVERNSSVYTGSESLVAAKADDRELIRISQLLYSEREYGCERVAAMVGSSMLSEKTCLIPAAAVYLGYADTDS